MYKKTIKHSEQTKMTHICIHFTFSKSQDSHSFTNNCFI